MEEARHRNKDCTQEQLRQRFDAILEERDRVWCAVPEEVLSYHLTRRHARIEQRGVGQYRVHLNTLPSAVPYRDLTFHLDVTVEQCRQPPHRRQWLQLSSYFSQAWNTAVDCGNGHSYRYQSFNSGVSGIIIHSKRN